jgi:anti-anti-sigma regulatory factor
VADFGHATGPVVVEFPDEFDFGSAGDVAVRLRAAIAAGVSVVVADLTTAAFCGSCGVRIMLLARDWASAGNAGLRLAVLPGPTLVALKLAAVDELLPTYPSPEEALAGEPVPDADAPPR